MQVGGSAITDKTAVETLKQTELAASARQIAAAVRGGVRLVVVHGAGSFGHSHARKFRVKMGFHCEEGKESESGHYQFGFADTRRSVTRLNHYLVEALVKEGVPAVGVSPFPVWTCDNGELEADGVPLIEQLLDTGMAPAGDAWRCRPRQGTRMHYSIWRHHPAPACRGAWCVERWVSHRRGWCL